MADNYRGSKSPVDYRRRRYDNFGRGAEYNLAIKRFAPRATRGPPHTEKYKYTIKANTTASILEKLRLFVATGPWLALILPGTRRRDVARRDERRTAHIPLTRSRSLERLLHLERNKGRRERGERRKEGWNEAGGWVPYPSPPLWVDWTRACRTFRVTFRTSPSAPFLPPSPHRLLLSLLLFSFSSVLPLFATLSLPICQFSALLTFPLFYYSPK